MDTTLKEMLIGMIRHLLTTVGGALVANGWITEGELAQMAAGVAAILVGAAWSLLHKKQAAANAADTGATG